MFLIERFWTITLLIVIFKSILIDSLPQGSSESGYTLQDDYTFSTNSDPLNLNEDVFTIAEKIKDCPNETGDKDDTRSGTPGTCKLRTQPVKVKVCG